MKASVRSPSLSPKIASSPLTTAACTAPDLSERKVVNAFRDGIATRVSSRAATPCRAATSVISVSCVSPSGPTAMRLPLRSRIFWISGAPSRYQVTFSVWNMIALIGAPRSAARMPLPPAPLNYLSVPVAEGKGFFRDGGLENETIVIPGSTSIAALVAGEVDYRGAGGSGMRAALRGAPIKAIMFQTEKVTWHLLGAPGTKKISGFKGKGS